MPRKSTSWSDPPSEDPMTLAFSREIKLAREIAGLSMCELSRQAGIKHHASIMWIERGHGTSIPTAVALCRVLGISLDRMFGIGAYAPGKPPESHQDAT